LQQYMHYLYVHAASRLHKYDKYPFIFKEHMSGYTEDIDIANGLNIPIFLLGKPFDPETRVRTEQFGVSIISILTSRFGRYTPSQFFDHDLQHLNSKSRNYNYHTNDWDLTMRLTTMATSEVVGTIPNFLEERSRFLNFVFGKVEQIEASNPEYGDRVWYVLNEIFHEQEILSHPLHLYSKLFEEGHGISDYNLSSIVFSYQIDYPQVKKPVHDLFAICRLIASWSIEYLKDYPQHKDKVEKLKAILEKPDHPFHTSEQYKMEEAIP